MEKLIYASPFILGGILLLAGLGFRLARTRGGILTEGVVTGVATTQKKYARVKVDVAAPIVKYSVGKREFCGTAARFTAEGAAEYKKGKTILIRVSRRNHSRFVPAQSGSLKEIFLIGGGLCIMLAYAIILVRYVI